MSTMEAATKAFRRHRETLQDAIIPACLLTLLLRLEEKEVISSMLRIEISDGLYEHSNRLTMLFTALEKQFLIKPDAYLEFLDCLEKVEIFDPLVDQMKATHGKFTEYMYEETLSLLNAWLCGLPPVFFILCTLQCR